LRRSERKRAAKFNWQNHICISSKKEDNFPMSSRETVIELVGKLPENTSLAEIAREIELLAGIQEGRRQARRGEGIPAEDARKLVDAWASK
jgi:hypothetical protein